MITLELVVSLDSSFAAFGVARLDSQSLKCRQTGCSGGSPKQIFESNKWLLINRYRQECMRIAKEFYDESIFNTSHGTQREWHPWTSCQSHLRKRNGEVQGVRLGPLRMCETTTN